MSAVRRAALVPARMKVMLGLLLSAACSAPLVAQDTTAVYPRHLSYFPYLTASPNDGVMGLARAVWFRQSRWDDRASIHDQLAIEGGFSTRNAWLMRAAFDAPQLGHGWRLQASAEGARERGYLFSDDRTTRVIGGAEVTRSLTSHVLVALRGEAMHVSVNDSSVPGQPPLAETDARARLALIYDARDREYDTRRGALVQVGALGGSAASGYTGVYGEIALWLPANDKLRFTTREGFRHMDKSTLDATRIVPAWENEFRVGGGPQSNRALPLGAGAGRDVQFASGEVRYDLKVFPGGAVAVLAFVDGSHTGNSADVTLQQFITAENADRWIVGAGGGVAVRLLRNAVLNATIARALHATRFYVSSGWSW